jgi:hypothetical protein
MPRRLVIPSSPCCVIAAGIFGWKWMHPTAAVPTPGGHHPKFALAALTGPKTFFPAAARATLEKEKPALIPEGLRDPAGPLAQKLPQATQDPKLFRELDRAVRFDEVWLPATRVLTSRCVEHLLETTDFTLAYLDHTSIVFRRNGRRLESPSSRRRRVPVRLHAGPGDFSSLKPPSRLAVVRRVEDARRYLNTRRKDFRKIPRSGPAGPPTT